MNGSIEENANDGGVPPLGAGFIRRFGMSLAGLGVLAVLSGCQQPQVIEVPVEVLVEVPVEVPVEVSRCELPALKGGQKFVVEAWAIPDARFDVGEPLRLQMRVSTPAYMNIFYVSTSCKVTRLLHNRAMSAAEIVDFPLRETGLQMTVKPPAGNEAFYFIAARSPMDFLSGADILSKAAGIASLDLSPAQFYQRLDDARGRINPDDWSITTLRTSVIGQ